MNENSMAERGGFADSIAIENMQVIDFTIRKICKTVADSQLQRDLQANLLQFTTPQKSYL
jgi:hypothetical protein